MPDPGWADDDERLCLPLLPWSSSTLLAPPYDSFPRLWLKLLMYLLIGAAGFGELDADDATVFSGTIGTLRKDAGKPVFNEDRFRA
jgi:hypothetical protein